MRLSLILALAGCGGGDDPCDARAYPVSAYLREKVEAECLFDAGCGDTGVSCAAERLDADARFQLYDCTYVHYDACLARECVEAIKGLACGDDLPAVCAAATYASCESEDEPRE